MDTVKRRSAFRWQFLCYYANRYFVFVGINTDLGLLWVTNNFYYNVHVFLFN